MTKDTHTRHKGNNVRKDLIFLHGSERDIGRVSEGWVYIHGATKKSMRAQQCRLGHSRQKKGPIQTPEF